MDRQIAHETWWFGTIVRLDGLLFYMFSHSSGVIRPYLIPLWIHQVRAHDSAIFYSTFNMKYIMKFYRPLYVSIKITMMRHRLVDCQNKLSDMAVWYVHWSLLNVCPSKNMINSKRTRAFITDLYASDLHKHLFNYSMYNQSWIDYWQRTAALDDILRIKHKVCIIHDFTGTGTIASMQWNKHQAVYVSNE